jgi:hypothetical protein
VVSTLRGAQNGRGPPCGHIRVGGSVYVCIAGGWVCGSGPAEKRERVTTTAAISAPRSESEIPSKPLLPDDFKLDGAKAELSPSADDPSQAQASACSNTVRRRR